jgi:phage gpG-like protein
MGYKLVLADGELAKIRQRFMPSREKMEPVSALLKSQIRQRFETHGESGGVYWPSRRQDVLGISRGYSVLRGPRDRLYNSWENEADESSAVCASNMPAAILHQLGTIGKGGELPTLRPKSGKKYIYWPLTDRAHDGWRPYLIRGRIAGVGFSGTRSGRYRFVGQRIEPPEADYLLVKTADLPPRPMLPDGNAESEAQTDLVVDVIANGPQ